jgi:circadian clock protein KaiB
MSEFSFKLYITGNTPRSERAVANLRRLCEERLGGRFSVEVIDLLEQPEVAEAEKILTTPTLVKETPPPVRRITGDLTDGAKVLLLLALEAPGPQAPQGTP